VVREDEIIDEETLPPTHEEIKANEIGIETFIGEEVGVDAILATSDNSTGTSVKTDPVPDKPYTYVEQMPSFPGGEKAMYEYIYQRIQYPVIARENGISGLVVLQFVVNTDGTIEDVKVVHEIGGGCGEEALRVINDMPKWKPGKHNGRNVPVTFTLPIRYVLQ
jgi:protein TonB